MKFGAKLRAYAVPEWQAAYVRYDALKALIRRYETELGAAAKEEEREEERQRPQELQGLDATPSPGRYGLHRLLSTATQAGSSDAADASSFLHVVDAEGAAGGFDKSASADVPKTEAYFVPAWALGGGKGEIVERVRRKAIEEFDALLETEVEKVERHFWEKLRMVRDRLRAVEEELCLLVPPSGEKNLQASRRNRGANSERQWDSDSCVTRSWQSHSRSSGGPTFRGEQVRERKHFTKTSAEGTKSLGSPVSSGVQERKTPFISPVEHASERSEGEDDSSGDGDEARTALSTAKALIATETMRLHSARPPLHDRRKEFSGSETGLRATMRGNAAGRHQASCTARRKRAVLRSSEADAGTEMNEAPIRSLRNSIEILRENHDSEGLETENLYRTADNRNGGTTPHARTASRSAEVDAEFLEDSLGDSDVDAKWNDYSSSVLPSSRRFPLRALTEQREETSGVRSAFAQQDAKGEFLLRNGEDEAHSAEREAHVAHLRRLQRVIISILDTFEKLQGFANLNLICVYKILKKRDKKIGTQLLRESFSYYESRLNALVIPKSLKTTVVALYRRTCRAVGQEDGIAADDTVRSFHRLQMAVQKDMLTRRASAVASRSRPLYFSMGCVCTLFINVLILASRKASNPNFREETLIAYLPIYRIVFECSFATMACAVSMACMEAYGVNYKFLLDIDPKSQVDSTTMFGLATLQQLVFFLTFALFLLDYKFAVFGTHNLYWLYMPALLLLQLLLLALPHPTFRLTYRKHILDTVVRVFRAGLLLTSDVTLLQNLVGDVLTSFSKPLGDVEYLVCFYATGLDHAAKPQCVGEGWIRPVLVGIPFYLRLCQCICRYRARKGDAQTQRLHLLNCGKYIAGILVIVCNSLPWESFGVSPYSMCLIWVSSYVCGTIYMFFWDVKVDWGLMPDPDHFLRSAGRSMYPPWMYQSIAVGNLIGRLTWATTLMPVSFSSLRSHLLNLIISLVELSRRAAWVVLRLENEHISNSSKYRATLWVPPLYQSSAVILLEEKEMPTRVKTWPTQAPRLQGDIYSAPTRRRDREDMVPSPSTQNSTEGYLCEDRSPERLLNTDEEGKVELLAKSRDQPTRPCSF